MSGADINIRSHVIDPIEKLVEFFSGVQATFVEKNLLPQACFLEATQNVIRAYFKIPSRQSLNVGEMHRYMSDVANPDLDSYELNLQ